MMQMFEYLSQNCAVKVSVIVTVVLVACGPQKDPYAGRQPDLTANQGDSSSRLPDQAGQEDSGKQDPSDEDEVLDYDWKQEALLATVNGNKNNYDNFGSDRFEDILGHGKPDFRDNPATTAHETLHGIHSVMRGATAVFDTFIYYRQGTGLYVKEPKANLQDVRNHIGASFRKLSQSKYDLYLIQQSSDWPNTLYLFDEWAAYIASAATAIEAQAAGRWTSTFANKNSDPIEGVSEFAYFCSAAILSIKNIDPDYLKHTKQFKAAFAMNMEESVRWLNRAKSDPFWQRSRAFEKFENLRIAADAEPVRNAVRELMGPGWTQRVMGF
jgi:hypothetical protein